MSSYKAYQYLTEVYMPTLLRAIYQDRFHWMMGIIGKCKLPCLPSILVYTSEGRGGLNFSEIDLTVCQQELLEFYSVLFGVLHISHSGISVWVQGNVHWEEMIFILFVVGIDSFTISNWYCFYYSLVISLYLDCLF